MSAVYDGAMALADPAVHRLTSAEFDRIVASGALDDMRVELLDGLLIDAVGQGPQHAALLQAFNRWLGARLDLLRTQLPLACAEGWTPEPDLALAPDLGPDAHPTTAFVVVEVMVSRHAEARRKLPGYALAEVPQVWLVDVPARSVHILTAPEGDIYARGATHTGDELLDPQVEGIAARSVGSLFEDAGL